MILGLLKSALVTSNGYPSVVFIRILVSANTATKKHPDEIVETFSIALCSLLEVELIIKLAVIAMENPVNNAHVKIK